MSGVAPKRAWPKDMLDKHVGQVIRETVEIACHLERDEDDNLRMALRENGGGSIWRIIQHAIREAGWDVVESPNDRR